MTAIQGRKGPRRVDGQLDRRLVMPNSPESLDAIRAFVAAAIADLPLESGADLDIVLAAGEAATNCVIHGQSVDGAPNTITARVMSLRNSVRVELQDCGRGFRPDLACWPAPALSAERGRGVFIMKCLMDDIRYPDVASGTLCVLTKAYQQRRQVLHRPGN